MSRSYVFTGNWDRKASKAPHLVFTTSLAHFDNAVKTVLEPAGKTAVEIRVRPVRDRRSTGYRSQNHAINSWVSEIARHCGEGFDTVKTFCKREAISRGYPIMTDASGDPIYSRFTKDVIPISEADATKEEASALISTIEQVAAELDIVLPQYDEEGS